MAATLSAAAAHRRIRSPLAYVRLTQHLSVDVTSRLSSGWFDPMAPSADVPPIYSIHRRNLGILHHHRIRFPACIRSSKSSRTARHGATEPVAKSVCGSLIGSVRRECLDHSIILNERHLRRILGSYLDHYHGSRTHLSIGKDTPDGRPVQPAGSGTVVSLPKVGGLHHRYERLAA